MDHLRRFYADEYVEDVRLTRSPHGRLEFARTVELLGRVLPDLPSRVLDVGGATGIHARWLAEAGYDVTLVDLMPEHVEQAGRIEGVRAAVGDARALDAADDAFDVVLLLGPLYHLIEAAERAAALREAARVARPGALVAAAAIGRYAGLLDFGAHAGLDEASEPLVRETLQTGLHNPELGFTTAYLHRPEELHGELVAAGLRDVEVYGVEGPSGPALDAHGIERIDEFLEAALRCARIADRDVSADRRQRAPLGVGYGTVSVVPPKLTVVTFSDPIAHRLRPTGMRRVPSSSIPAIPSGTSPKAPRRRPSGARLEWMALPASASRTSKHGPDHPSPSRSCRHRPVRAAITRTVPASVSTQRFSDSRRKAKEDSNRGAGAAKSFPSSTATSYGRPVRGSCMARGAPKRSMPSAFATRRACAACARSASTTE
jgi:SAM-dependent methyltransferase